MENWPVLIAFNFTHEAHQVKGYLEANGVETFLKDELTTQVISYLPSAIGGVKLLVRESDYEQGIQLLKEGGYLIEADSEPESKIETVLFDKTTDQKICPFCKSANIEKDRQVGAIAAILFAILNLFFMMGTSSPRFKSAFKCYNCGKEWKFRKR